MIKLFMFKCLPHMQSYNCKGVLNQSALLLRPCFIKAILIVEKAVIVLKNGPTSSPVAKICHLQYANFVLLVGDAAKEATDSCVQNFAPGCCGT